MRRRNKILYVSPEVQKYIRIEAAKQGLTMKDYCNKTLLPIEKSKKYKGGRKFDFGF